MELAVVRGAAQLTSDGGSISRQDRRARVRARRWRRRAVPRPSTPRAWTPLAGGPPARRDERLGRATSSRYLPTNLQMYGGTFDRYGAWENDAANGYVWYPTVDPGWRPYYNGYWSPLRTYGMTWIGLDAWGWPTHHYGRWGYARSRWFWVPERRWAPAWVSWATAPDYVSWCPIGLDNRPVFSLSVSSGNRWAGWVVLPRARLGREATMSTATPSKDAGSPGIRRSSATRRRRSRRPSADATTPAAIPGGRRRPCRETRARASSGAADRRPVEHPRRAASGSATTARRQESGARRRKPVMPQPGDRARAYRRGTSRRPAQTEAAAGSPRLRRSSGDAARARGHGARSCDPPRSPGPGSWSRRAARCARPGRRLATRDRGHLRPAPRLATRRPRDRRAARPSVSTRRRPHPRAAPRTQRRSAVVPAPIETRVIAARLGAGRRRSEPPQPQADPSRQARQRRRLARLNAPRRARESARPAPARESPTPRAQPRSERSSGDGGGGARSRDGGSGGHGRRNRSSRADGAARSTAGSALLRHRQSRRHGAC